MFEKLQTKLAEHPVAVKIACVGIGIIAGVALTLVVASALDADDITDIVEHIEETGEIAEQPF